jgi:transposase-like protein
MEDLFKGRQFREIIIRRVRWHLSASSTFRDLMEMTEERAVSLVHTIMRWIARYVP